MIARPEKSPERRLVAIFVADVAGYSRLMGEDEVETLRLLTAHREIVDGLIVRHRGRIANTAGDSVLAEFPSAVDAVQCGTAIQQRLGEANASTSRGQPPPVPDRHSRRRRDDPGRRSVRRRGEHCGAAPEPLPSREVYASPAEAHAHVRKTLPLAFQDLGPQQVKNIAEPVRRLFVQTPAHRPSVAHEYAVAPTSRESLDCRPAVYEHGR